MARVGAEVADVLGFGQDEVGARWEPGPILGSLGVVLDEPFLGVLLHFEVRSGKSDGAATLTGLHYDTATYVPLSTFLAKPPATRRRTLLRTQRYARSVPPPLSLP